ncbi:MAG: biotin/lipoyl-binding protein [Clostridia bacterium]|nr:biotin/lipoyl-binding protein [Clostridia bacterium]
MKRFNITVNGKAYDVQVEEIGGTAPVASPVSAPAPVAAPTPVAVPTPAPVAEAVPAPVAAPAAQAAGTETILAPMPGTIVNIVVSAGQAVKSGEVLLVLEAMKMENEIMAPRDGVVAGVHVNKGDSVDSGALLVSLQ